MPLRLAVPELLGATVATLLLLLSLSLNVGVYLNKLKLVISQGTKKKNKKNRKNERKLRTFSVN